MGYEIKQNDDCIKIKNCRYIESDAVQKSIKKFESCTIDKRRVIEYIEQETADRKKKKDNCQPFEQMEKIKSLRPFRGFTGFNRFLFHQYFG
jgi:hypothetical protein